MFAKRAYRTEKAFIRECTDKAVFHCERMMCISLAYRLLSHVVHRHDASGFVLMFPHAYATNVKYRSKVGKSANERVSIYTVM